jgi:hypothetical protein
MRYTIGKSAGVSTATFNSNAHRAREPAMTGRRLAKGRAPFRGEVVVAWLLETRQQHLYKTVAVDDPSASRASHLVPLGGDELSSPHPRSPIFWLWRELEVHFDCGVADCQICIDSHIHIGKIGLPPWRWASELRLSGLILLFQANGPRMLN